MAKWVLIVNSDLAANVIISKTLSKAGFETRTAFTSDEALTRTGQDKFDLIIADLGLPNGESRQLLIRLNQAGVADAVPILALADGIEDQLAKSAMQLGATEILAKPIAADQLVTRVKRAIERGPRGQVSQRVRKGDRAKGDAGGGPTPAPAAASDLGVAAAPSQDGLATTALATDSSPGNLAARAREREAPPAAPPPPLAPGAPKHASPAPRSAEPAPRAAEPAQAAPAEARRDRPDHSTSPPRGVSTLASSGPTAARGLSGATGAPAGGSPATERGGKTGVSTIQLDARNFIDKHAGRAEPSPEAHGPLSEGDELQLERRCYHIVRALAAGAMGGTYLARRTGERGGAFSEEIDCVLKVSFGDPVADESLRVEQLVLGAIDHPNVVKLLDMGFLPGQDGARFVVLERLYPLPPAFVGRGHDAPAWERALDPVTAMRLYLNLVGGLHAIHAKHRLILGDIKPDNVMLRMPRLDGRDVRADYFQKLSKGELEPVFIDFGSALSQEVLHTRKVETFTGSPAYMAPEVLTQGRHSARRDVFALSATLYELLTGERPYGELGARPVPELVEGMRRGAPAIELDRVKALRFEEPFAEAAGPDPAAARAQFLRNVSDMIARGADRDPAQRYSTYQLADECRIRFSVRARSGALPGARYETSLFQPLDPVRNRYTQAPRPPEPSAAAEAPSTRGPKSGRGSPVAPPDPFASAAAGAPASSAAPPSGGGGGVSYSAAAYTAGQGILGPPPSAAPSPSGGGGATAQGRRLEIENAELRLACLRAEERVRVAEDAVAARDLALSRVEERGRQLDEAVRERDQKRAETHEKAKRASERAQKAEESIALLEKAVREAERRASASEQQLAGAKPVQEKWKEAADLLERGVAAARAAAEGARAIAAEARKKALAEALADLGPLFRAVEEARKDRPDDDPPRVTDAEPAKLLDAIRALVERAGRPGA